MCTIKHLIVDIEFVGKEYIPLIARLVAPTLSSLDLGFWDGDTEEDMSLACYEDLCVFFEHCDGIRALKLVYFDFGDDPVAIPQAVKDGTSRLNQLNLIDCRGDIRMFIENTPIPSLKILRYGYESEREAESDEEIISAIASNYRELTQVKLIAVYGSSKSLLKIFELCRDLESLVLTDVRSEMMLERSDILALATLPRLKSLRMDCVVASDACFALARCKGLKELHLDNLVDPTVLAAIGRSLVSLRLWGPSMEVVDGIVEHCPNLQYLDLRSLEYDDEEEMALLVGSIKNGLKKLAKIKVDDDSICLGTDWDGYP